MAIKVYKKTLIFAGTTEGHELARHMKEKGILKYAEFCVATEYGAEVLSDVKGVNIHTGAMDKKEIENVLGLGEYGLVVDATHPFARIVTENLKEATKAADVPYIRLLRSEETYDTDENVKIVESVEAAVKLLNKSQDSFLLTTGAKELKAFSAVENFSDRAVARVLPFYKSLEACAEAGLTTKNIIAMQGPFTLEMNTATMKQYKLKTIVTKSTGKAGGFYEKVALAEKGYNIIIIGRPENEIGETIYEVMKRLDGLYE